MNTITMIIKVHITVILDLLDDCHANCQSTIKTTNDAVCCISEHVHCSA